MVKKTVRLEAQERFDLIDALEMQNGVFDYVGQALGRLMGWGNGLLSDISSEIVQDNGLKLRFSDKFAFYVTTENPNTPNSFKGEVVVFDAASEVQTVTSIDLSQALSAANTFFETGGGQGAGDGTIVQEVGSGAAPFVWARPTVSDGVQDARRKWSIALQTETPVTIPTRSITNVEFRVSEAKPASDTVDGGMQNWAPIFRITNWSKAKDGTPILVPVSAFDSHKWHIRTEQDKAEEAERAGGVFGADYYNADNYNLSSTRIFSSYPTGDEISGIQSMNPPVSPIYDVLLNISTFEDADEGSESFNNRIAYLARLIKDNALPDGYKQRTNPGAAAPWLKETTHPSAGVFDQLSAIRAVLKNIVGLGVFDYNRRHSKDNPFCAPFEGGYEPISASDWAPFLGPMTAHWSALPLRSVNNLAFENMVMKSELAAIKKKIDDLTETVQDADDGLDARVTALENEADPFSDTPINDAQPLIPALALTYKARYGNAVTHNWHGGPANSVKNVKFFVNARMQSQVTYAHGGVRITLSNATYEALGNGDVAAGKAALLAGQCMIQATPIHFEGSNGFLFPHSRFPIGKISERHTTHVPQISGPNRIDLATKRELTSADSYVKTYQRIVLQQFANFYTCTLNVILRDWQNDLVIEICPVNTMPDIVETGADLRGYPHWDEVINKMGSGLGEAENNDKWWAYLNNLGRGSEYLVFEEGDGTTPSEAIAQNAQQLNDQCVILKTLAGDTTNPDCFQHEKDVEGNRAGLPDDLHENDQTGGIFGYRDDLRGFAHSVTYLRPDRYFSTGRGTSMDSGYYEYSSVHRPTDNGAEGLTERHQLLGEYDEAAGRGAVEKMDLKTHGEFGHGAEAIGGHNGRFMPSFSLLIYKASFTGMGTAIDDDSVSSQVSSGVSFTGPDGVARPTHETYYLGNELSRRDDGGVGADTEGNSFPDGVTTNKGGRE